MRWLTTPLQTDGDVVTASSRLRAWSEALGLESIAHARVVTLGGELARAAASSGEGSIEFGWSSDGGRPWCAIEAPASALQAAATHVGDAGLHLTDLDVVFERDERDGARGRLRIDARSRAPRESVERAVIGAADVSAIDVLKAQNLEMARMLSTLRDREAELVRALDEARNSANEAAAHALRVEELSKKKDELLAIASHDIRSPVAAAKGALELLDPTLTTLSDDQRHLLGVARRGCDAVVHLLANLMSTALIELPDDEPNDDAFDLAATTREIVELMAVPARQKNAEIHVHSPSTVPAVRGDATWARQIVSNLINNALKYAPKQGGRIDVSIEERAGELRFVVEDNGIGIPPDKIDRVFDKLARLRPRGTAGERGTGIGLYVTKKLVERIGGAIVVRAREGGGTRFEVRLPTNAATNVSPSSALSV